MAKIYGLNAAVDLAASKQIAFNSLFSRGNGQPLDSTQLWYPKDGKTGYERAVEYAKTNAAYVGQELGIVEVTYEADGTTVKSTAVTFYGVQDANGTLKEIGSVPVGDDLSIEVVDEKIQIKGFGDHYYVWHTSNVHPTTEYLNTDFSNGETWGSIFVDDYYDGLFVKGANNTWAICIVEEHSGDVSWRQATAEEIATIEENDGYERVEGFISGLEQKVILNNDKLELAWCQPSTDTIDGINSTITSLQNTVKNIESNISDLDQDVRDVWGTLTPLAEVVGDQADQASETVNTVWANINSLKTKDTDLEGRLANVEKDYLVEADKTELDGKITAAANRVGALETKVDTGDKTVSAYVAKVVSDAVTAAELGKLTKVIADSVNIETNKVVIDGVETEPADSVIYMVKVDNATGDVYKEYMLINSVLVQTGDTTTDLSNYYTKDQIDKLVPVDLGVMSVGVGSGLEKTGTDADPVLDLKLAAEQGNVTLDKTDGLKASIDLSDYAKSEDVADVYATKEFVGDIPVDAEATSVTGYVKEAFDEAIAESNSVKQELTTYKTANDPKINALLAEVYGPLAEGQTAYDYNADSRIDALEKADAAQDTLIASNTELAQKGVDDAKTANTAIATLTGTGGRIATIETNVTNLQTLTEGQGKTIAEHTTKIATIETTIGPSGTLGLKIAELDGFKTAQTEVNKTVNQAINTDLPAAIALKLDASEIKKYSTTDAMNIAIADAIEDKADKTDLAAYAKTTDLAPYAKTQDVHNTYATITALQEIYSLNEHNKPIGILPEEIERAKAAEKKNADAITTLNGDDTGKSVRTIAAEELAAQLIPESVKESLDTLTEIAVWIQEHPEDAAEMNAKIATHDTLLAGIGGTDQPATVIAAIQDAVDNLEPLAVATATKLGGVISAQDSVVEGATVTAANAVYVAADTGAMSVKTVTTDILVNGANELILFGGNAQATVTE